MKNLGIRWTGPNIPRTAAARTLLIVAITSSSKIHKLKLPINDKLNNQEITSYIRCCWTSCGNNNNNNNTNIIKKQKFNYLCFKNIKNKLHYLLSVRNKKNLIKKKSVYSKFKYHNNNINNDICISNLQSLNNNNNNNIHRLNYITIKTHCRRFRKC